MLRLFKIIPGERRSSAKLNTCERYNLHFHFLVLISWIGLLVHAHRTTMFLARANAVGQVCFSKQTCFNVLRSYNDIHVCYRPSTC